MNVTCIVFTDLDAEQEVGEDDDDDVDIKDADITVATRPETLSELRASMIAAGAPRSFAWTCASRVTLLDRCVPLSPAALKKEARAIAEWHEQCWARCTSKAERLSKRAHLRRALAEWCGLKVVH